MREHPLLGVERCLDQPPPEWTRQRLGLLVNRASVDYQYRPTLNRFAQQFPDQLKAIFTPQHGLWGDAQANMVETPHGRHADLQLPVHSLYSETREPTEAMLAEIDCLIVDLQDVGTRVYTFIWTLQACLRRCAERDVAIVVLDRPNPLGGEIVEGPLLQSTYKSFVGGAEMPMRHALTIGEVAKWFNQEFDADLTVIPMENWRTDCSSNQRSLIVPPSPNMPTTATALVYPGQVLLEGTTLSEGRGTTMPFEWLGAPDIDAGALQARLESWRLPGVQFLPLKFRPTFDKWQDELCEGVSIQVSDPELFRSYPTSVAILAAVREIAPDSLRWNPPPYEYEQKLPPIDILAGSDQLRRVVDDLPAWGTSYWNPVIDCPLDTWRHQVEDALLYESGDRFK